MTKEEKTGINIEIPHLDLVDVYTVADLEARKKIDAQFGDVAHQKNTKLNRPLTYYYDGKWKVLFSGSSVEYYKVVFRDLDTGKKTKFTYPVQFENNYQDVLAFAENMIEGIKKSDGKNLRLSKLKLIKKQQLL